MIENKKKNYRIFRVEEISKRKRILHNKITMMYIYAKNDDDAYEQLKSYRKIANKIYTYYVERWTTITVIREDGTKHTYNDFLEEIKSYRKNKPFYIKIYNFI